MQINKVDMYSKLIEEYVVILSHEGIEYRLELWYQNGMFEDVDWYEVRKDGFAYRTTAPDWWVNDESQIYGNLIKQNDEASV